MTKYNIKDIVYILWSRETYMISEISIDGYSSTYKLWRVWTESYAWYDEWQMTDEEPSKIGFNTND